MTELFQQYLQAGKYLKGWSPRTPEVYQRAFTSFQQSQRECGSSHPLLDTSADTNYLTKAQLEVSKQSLESWVVWMRQRGLSPACINIYIRSLNSFCAWLKEEGHLEKEIKLKQVPAPLKPVTVFSDADIKLILSFKPRTFTDFRNWTLLCLMLDTGCRINELLTLPEGKVDMDNMLLTVNGKGDKTRIVPFSAELRKSVFRYLVVKARKYGQIKGRLLFSSRHGSKLMYRNVYRDMIKLCQTVGITKRVHPHLTRHSFACHFMKHGGSIYTLSRILGHSSVSTTQLYIRGLGVEDFHEEHARLSPLMRAR